MRRQELQDAAFACIPGCGFCCTFQPEAGNRELALLRQRLGTVRTISDGGRAYLALHNKCGACTLLERRECQAYDLRPRHCRYFPFHVHFAEEPEVYVNFTCRGVAHATGRDLAPEFQAQVLDVASTDEWRAHEQASRETYGEFQRRARRAGAWGDVDAAVARVLGEGARLLTGPGILGALARAGEERALDEVHAEALEPFGSADVTKRPFHLAGDLRWLTFERQGDALRVLEMDERGELTPVHPPIEGLSAWAELPPGVPGSLFPYVQRLASRRAFAGSVYALVDDADYQVTVEQAAWMRAAQVGSDLVVRARVLLALGTPEDRIAEETARFYDSAFLDAPTIGGWL